MRLFQDALVALASVPALYPPVMIQAVGDRGPVSEMHVDGATTTQVFVVPGILKQGRSPGGGASASHVHLWVIINNTPPEFGLTTPGAIPIAVRSIATLMKSQTGDAVKAASEAAARLGMDFNVAYIDKGSATYDPSHPFAKSYMDAVFAIGRDEARTGVLWRRSLMP